MSTTLITRIGSWLLRASTFATAGCSLFIYFISTGSGAYQDAASLLDRATMPSERWRAILLSAPYGSDHSARVALSVDDGEAAPAPAPVGVKLAGAAQGSMMILESGGGVKITTGSTARDKAARQRRPQVVQETKSDLLMSRTGISGRVVADPASGRLIRRTPRLLLEPETERLPRSSFARPDDADDQPIRLASLNFDNIFLERPRLETPIEAVERRKEEQRQLARELHCMATAIYFEARGESERGQRAVAQVILNRVEDYRYPDTVCDVVYQNRHWRNRCQFSFACDGKPKRIRDQRSWARAMAYAEDALINEFYLAEIGGSTHYHANYVRPRWSRALRRIDRIGTHIFYKLRPGQT